MKKILAFFFFTAASATNIANSADLQPSSDSYYHEGTDKIVTKKCGFESSYTYDVLAVYKCKTSYKDKPAPAPQPKPQVVEKAAKPQESQITQRPTPRSQPVQERQERKQYTSKKRESSKDKDSSGYETKGHYVGVDFIANKGRLHEEYSRIKAGQRVNYVVKPSSTDTGGGIGLNYKYAFNLNSIFIAPGLFVEGLATEINLTEEAYGSSAQYGGLTITDRFGAFVNLGYDVNSWFSPYIVAGYAGVGYKSKNGIISNTGSVQTAIKQSRAKSSIYGFGLKINLNKSLSLNAEVNRQNFRADTRLDVSNNTRDISSSYVVRLDSLKVGIAYNF